MSNADTSAAQPLSRIGSSWGWLLTFGMLTLLTLLTLLAGLVALAWPGPTILVIAVIFGFQLLVGGIYWFVSAVAESRAGPAAV